MRIIWRKNFGFTLLSYPWKGDDEDSKTEQYKLAITDAEGSLWWLSDEATEDESALRKDSEEIWAAFIWNYVKDHTTFPDGSICDLQPEVMVEKTEPATIKEAIQSKKKRKG